MSADPAGTCRHTDVTTNIGGGAVKANKTGAFVGPVPEVYLVIAQAVAATLLPNVGVGVICAIFGGPFILYLLASRHSGEGRDI